MIHKLFFSSILIGFLFLFTANASKYKERLAAEIPQSVIKSRYIINDNLFAKTVLSGALTSGPEYNGGFGIQGMLDYRIQDRVSAGLQGNLYFLESKLTTNRQLSINLRANYHLVKEKRFESNDWDWYFGIDLGGDLEGGNQKITEFKEFVGIHTGLRYKLNYKWIVFTEVGSRNASLGLAISL